MIRKDKPTRTMEPYCSVRFLMINMPVEFTLVREKGQTGYRKSSEIRYGVADPSIIKKNRTYAFEAGCAPEDKVKTSATGPKIANTG
jgi:hypothetical protein